MSRQTLLYKGCFILLTLGFWGCGAGKKPLSSQRSALRLAAGGENTRVGGALIRFSNNHSHKEVMPYSWDSLESSESIQYLQDFYKTAKTELTPFRFLLSKKAKARCKLDPKSDQILTTALTQTLQELKAQVYKLNKITQNKNSMDKQTNKPIYTIEGQGNLWICRRKKKRKLIFEVHTQVKKKGSNKVLDLQMDLRLHPKDFEGSTRKKRDTQAKKQGLTQITYHIADDLYRCFEPKPVSTKLNLGINLKEFKTHQVECKTLDQ